MRTQSNENQRELFLKKVAEKGNPSTETIQSEDITPGETSEEKIKILQRYAKERSPLFIQEFIKTYPKFTKNLLNRAPNLILAEVELCAYSKLRLGNQEIAFNTKTSVRSVESRKYRVRKKLKLQRHDNFLLWIMDL
jgi:DNA-binding CsgD family transcriptional regulator